ncbi:sterol carrier protein domain-containing protein [Enterococcus cecorum]|uniref:sterol carrier protein domain-containing protein n=1 Tax=Enterococcus cecorum TaxID=44008 RepID=UPI0032643A15
MYYPNRFYVVIYDEIHPVGYLIYRKMGSTFQVEELIYLHFNALKASLQYIKSHQSTFQEVTICASIQERLEWLFPEQKRIEIKICPYMMKRILHIEQILAQYEALISLVIQVTQDDICSQNVGYWQYHGDSWQKTTAKEADLSADITTFSALLLGELTVDEAIFTQRLQASAKAQKLKLPSLNQQFFDYY